jgi:hypothetical protein
MCHGMKERRRRRIIMLGVTIESYGKVEISYINVDNF